MVECELPFEIRHTESNSFATGIAAGMVLLYLYIIVDNDSKGDDDVIED